MRTLPVFDPFVDFDRFFEGLAPSRPRHSAIGGNTVPLDVYERDGTWIVKASLPGVQPDQIEVTIEESLLTLRAQLSFDEAHEDAKVYRREIASGSFVRSVRLPKDVDTNGVSATFEHGLVTNRLPRLAQEKPAAVTVPVKAIESSSS